MARGAGPKAAKTASRRSGASAKATRKPQPNAARKAPRRSSKPVPAQRRQRRRKPVVVVGGSAGALESLRVLLRELPATFPAPILVVLHLDPNSPSNAAALLEAHTQLPVRQAEGGEIPRAGTVYLPQPDRHLELRSGRIHLGRSPRVHFSRPSVDRLFASAAREAGEGATAVVLSGTGSDGEAGVRRIRAAGGSVVVEDPATAAHPGMPQAAQGTSVADAVLPAAHIGAFLVHAARRPKVRLTAAAWLKAARLLKAGCRVDFQGYREATLRRRMEMRMAAAGSTSAARYVARLAHDAAELERLRSALLVKVSAFLRDRRLWDALRRHGLAPLMRRDGRREVRMWSAGCATGEEAYSLAMLAAAASPRPRPFKVFATDIDEPSLAVGRAGRYPAHAVRDLPPAMARRFLKSEGDARRIAPQLRRHVIFGRHDLVHDPPLASMDLVLCRNVLIYLKPAERSQALANLIASLRPGGILFLGRAEGATLPAPGFVRLAPGMPAFRRTAQDGAPRSPQDLGRSRVRLTARGPAPGAPILVALDAALRITAWSPGAEAAFGLPSEAAIGSEGPPTLGIPEHQLREAAASRVMRDLPVPQSGPHRGVALQALGIPGGAGVLLMGQALPTAHARPPKAKSRSRRDHAEPSWLASPQSQQALNEELQSRNEELETVNEELQSLNDEIQVQGDEARQATLFLTAMLDSGPDVFIGCDRKGRVSYWGKPAVRQFGLSAPQAIGKDLLDLIPRLESPGLRRLLRNGRKGTKAPRPQAFRLKDGLRVKAFAALDVDGRSHGTLLRVET